MSTVSELGKIGGQWINLNENPTPIDIYACCCGKPPHTRFSKRNEYEWYSRKKFDSGMTAEIQFEEWEHNEKTMLIDVSFVIYRKRKQAWSIPNAVTGKDGAEPLVWARQELKAFEDFIAYHEYRYPHIRIVIGWSDQRRGNLYRKALTKDGYRFVFSQEDGPSLWKEFDISNDTDYCWQGKVLKS